MANQASFRAVIHGHVQGVFFRAFAVDRANELGLKGFVRNLSDSSMVEVVAEGDRDKLRKLIEALNIGPPAAHVERLDISWGDISGSYSDFNIRY